MGVTNAKKIYKAIGLVKLNSQGMSVNRGGRTAEDGAQGLFNI